MNITNEIRSIKMDRVSNSTLHKATFQGHAVDVMSTGKGDWMAFIDGEPMDRAYRTRRTALERACEQILDF